MLSPLWRRLQHQATLWREVALPGLLIILLVLLIRWLGLLEVQELMAFDALSKRCPASTVATPVVIVGINEADLNAVGGFPIPDRTLVDLLNRLEEFNPSVIGLNLFRDRPVPPGSSAFSQKLIQSANLIGVETSLSSMPELDIAPPPALPPQRIGFVDATIDEDGKLRRIILASAGAEPEKTGQATLKYSFALQLARIYLKTQSAPFQAGVRASDSIQFGKFEFERFQPNTGGYARADVSGNQTLLNFCASQRLFPTLSLTDVLQRNFQPDLIRNQIVIIGMTAPSVKDVFFTSALRETVLSHSLGKLLPATQLIYGVEVQAHATDQMIHAVLMQQPPLRVWPDVSEYSWIAGWGLLGILLGILLQSPWESLLSLLIASAFLIGISFFALVLGWWLPLVPAGLTLGGAGLITTFFDRDLRFELEYRRRAVERTYEAVHNGPLQHLAVILRNLDGDSSPQPLRQQLQSLNEELRSIFEHMRQEMLTRSDRLYLKENRVLDLQAPIAELLYQVYNHTLEMPAPGFAAIQTYISPDFELLRRNHFRIAQKRGLCLFLQEALWNVGNHAVGTTRLDVMCVREANNYVLRITDNGSGLTSSREGEGTRQAKVTAWELGGCFQRRANHPQGTICELIFPMQRNWFSRFRRVR